MRHTDLCVGVLMFHIFISSCGRIDATLRLLNSIRVFEPNRNAYTIHLFDHSWETEFVDLIERGGALLDDVRIVHIPNAALLAYWPKNLFWRMFLASFAPIMMRPEASARVLMMLDNDIVFTRRFVDDIARLVSVSCNTIFDGMTDAPFFSRCWAASLSTWASMPSPDFRSVMDAHGNTDRVPTDTFYEAQIKAIGGSIVPVNPFAINQDVESERKARLIGADVQPGANGNVRVFKPRSSC